MKDVTEGQLKGGQRMYRLMVEPRPYTTFTQGQRWIMSPEITDEYLIEYGRKKVAERIAKGAKNPGNENEYLNIRKRYMKYVQFKIDVRKEAKRVSYFPRHDNVWIKFYFPMPKSWSKKKRNQHAWEKHQEKPDRGNCEKAISDALMKEDKFDWDGRSSKFYTTASKGYIEIEVGTLPPAKATFYSGITDELK